MAASRFRGPSRRSRAHHAARLSDAGCAAGGGVRVGVVEGMERVDAVDFELEGLVGVRVQNCDRDPV